MVAEHWPLSSTSNARTRHRLHNSIGLLALFDIAYVSVVVTFLEFVLYFARCVETFSARRHEHALVQSRRCSPTATCEHKFPQPIAPATRKAVDRLNTNNTPVSGPLRQLLELARIHVMVRERTRSIVANPINETRPCLMPSPPRPYLGTLNNNNVAPIIASVFVKCAHKTSPPLFLLCWAKKPLVAIRKC